MMRARMVYLDEMRDLSMSLSDDPEYLDHSRHQIEERYRSKLQTLKSEYKRR